MPDTWLPHDRLTGSWDRDAEQLRLIGWRFGPAGVAAVDLTPTLRVAVDHARPTTLCELLVAAPGGSVDAADRGPLRTLLGDDVLHALSSLTASSDGRLHHLGDDRPRYAPDPDDAFDHARMSRFLLAADLATDATRSPFANAIAGLEAAIVAYELTEQGPVPDLLARGLLDTHVDALLALATSGWPMRWSALPAAGDVVGRAIELLPGGDPRTKQLRDLLESEPDVRHARLSAVSGDMAPGATPAAAAVRQLRIASPTGDRVLRYAVDERATSSQPERAHVEVDARVHVIAWLTHGSHLQVLAPAHAAGDGDTWVRTFRRRDHLLLGLAPLRVDGSEARSLVVLPSGHRPDELIVDLTTTPEATRPSGTLVAVRAAIHDGRRASRLERLGERDNAAHAWLACSVRWDELGDEQRANLAREYSRGRGRDRRTSPEVRQVIISRLAADRID